MVNSFLCSSALAAEIEGLGLWLGSMPLRVTILGSRFKLRGLGFGFQA